MFPFLSHFSSSTSVFSFILEQAQLAWDKGFNGSLFFVVHFFSFFFCCRFPSARCQMIRFVNPILFCQSQYYLIFFYKQLEVASYRSFSVTFFFSRMASNASGMRTKPLKYNWTISSLRWLEWHVFIPRAKLLHNLLSGHARTNDSHCLVLFCLIKLARQVSDATFIRRLAMHVRHS